MTTKKTSQSTDAKKVLTPEFRVSFPAVFKAKSFEGQEPKYSITMLFDKKADLTGLKKAIQAAAVEKWGEDKAKWPKNLRTPLRDGDEKELDGYAGHYFVNASSKQKPGLVNQKVEPIISEDDFYAGCYARATLQAFAYDTAGNKGVSFGLQNIQKLRDGDTFSGRRRPSDEFTAVEDGSDDASNYENQDDDLGLN